MWEGRRGTGALVSYIFTRNSYRRVGAEKKLFAL